MAVAYSEDLRRCIIKAAKDEQQSVRELAKRFEVGKSFVGQLIQRYIETGSLSAKPHGGGERPVIGAEDLNWLKVKVVEKNDITLEELCKELEISKGIKVSQSTMCRALQKIGMTRKKKLSMLMSNREKKYKKQGENIKN
jgi:transposase